MSDPLRSAVIKLAHQNPELRSHLLPILVAADIRVAKVFPSQQALTQYLDLHPGADKSNHSVSVSESKAPAGGSEQGRGRLLQNWGSTDKHHLTSVGKQVEKGEMPARHQVEKALVHVKGFQADAKKFEPKERAEHKTMAGALAKLHKQTKEWHPDVHSMMSKHELEDTDSDQLKKFKGDKPSTGKPLSDQQLMAKFLAKAKPETKERMKGMSVADFKKMYAAINADEE